jgi:hypothetical protein
MGCRPQVKYLSVGIAVASAQAHTPEPDHYQVEAVSAALWELGPKGPAVTQ